MRMKTKLILLEVTWENMSVFNEGDFLSGHFQAFYSVIVCEF